MVKINTAKAVYSSEPSKMANIKTTQNVVFTPKSDEELIKNYVKNVPLSDFTPQKWKNFTLPPSQWKFGTETKAPSIPLPVAPSKNYSDNATAEAFQRKRYEAMDMDNFAGDMENALETYKKISSGWQDAETMKNAKPIIEKARDRLLEWQKYNTDYNIGIDYSEHLKAYNQLVEDWDKIAEEYAKHPNAEMYERKTKADEKYYDIIPNEPIITIESRIASYTSDLEEVNRLYKDLWNAQQMTHAATTPEEREKRSKAEQQALLELQSYLRMFGYGTKDEMVDDLQKKIGLLKSTKVQAERYRALQTLSEVGDPESENYDKDFEKYVKKGNEIDYHEVGTTKKGYGGGSSGSAYSYDVPDALRLAAMALAEHNGVEITEEKSEQIYSDYGFAILRYLEPKEFDTLAYYIAKDKETGGNQTLEYLELMEEELNRREGTYTFETYLKDNSFLEALYAVPVNLERFGTNLAYLFNTEDDYIPLSSTQVAGQLAREDLADDGMKLPEWLGGASGAQLAYDMLGTTTYMLPSILVGIVSKTGGAALMGMASAGGAYQEAINAGMDKGQARVYSTLVGASEAVMSRVLSKAFGGKAVSGKIATAIQGVENGFYRFALNMGTAVISEATEEGLQEILEPLFENIALGYNKNGFEDIDWSEVAYSALLGGLSGGMFEALGSGVKRIKSGIDVKRNYNTDSSVLGLLKLGLSFDKNSKAYKLANKYSTEFSTNKKISNKKIYNLATTLQNTVGYTLMKLGETNNVDAISSAVVKGLSGVELSAKEIELLSQSSYGQETLENLAPKTEGIEGVSTEVSTAETSTENINAPQTDIPQTDETDIERDSVFTEPSNQEIYRDPTPEENQEAIFGKRKNAKQRHIVDVAKKLDSNMKVVFVPKDGKVLNGKNGKFNRNSKTIYIAEDLSTVEMYVEVFKHEFVHRLELRKAYDSFKNYLFKKSEAFGDYAIGRLNLNDAVKGKDKVQRTREQAVNELIDMYVENTKGDLDLTREDAEREAVADFVARTLFKGNTEELRLALKSDKAEDFIKLTAMPTDLELFGEMAKTDRNLFQKIIDAIRDLIASIKGMPNLEKDLQYLEQRLARVYESVDMKKTATESGEVYANYEDAELYRYIEDALANDLPKKSFYKISDIISDKLASDIEKIVGFSVKGYSNEIAPGNIKHIEKEHGSNGKKDRSMSDHHDLARISFVIDNYEKIKPGKLSSQYKNSDGTFAKTIELQKKINDEFYYVVEAVPDANLKTLHIVSAYKNKKDTFSDVPVSNDPRRYVQDEHQPNVSTDIIRNKNDFVNNNSLNEPYSSDNLDTDYLKAVENGDMETAQKMVDEEAKNAGYDSPILYHGTRSFGFTQFDLEKMDDKRSIFLTNNKKIASTYSGVTGTRNISGSKEISNLSAQDIVDEFNAMELENKYKQGNMSLVAKLGKSLVIDGKNQNWNDIRNWQEAAYRKRDEVEIKKIGDEFKLYDKATNTKIPNGVMAVNSFTEKLDKSNLLTMLLDKANYSLRILTENLFNTREIAGWAKSNGYDSVTIKNIRDNGGWNVEVGYDETADIYIIFNPSNVKSADPVTYDKKGRVIPLSERFNENEADIRYSSDDLTVVQEQLLDRYEKGEITREQYQGAIKKYFEDAIAEVQDIEWEKQRELIDRNVKNKKRIKRQNEQLAKDRRELRREAREQIEERDLKQKNIENIRKMVKSLYTKLSTNNASKHIPEQFKKHVAEFLKVFYENDRSPFDRKDFEVLELVYNRYINEEAEGVEMGFDTDIQRTLQIFEKTLDGKTLRDLNVHETRMLRELLDNFSQIINWEDKMRVNGTEYETDQVGKTALNELESTKSKRENVLIKLKDKAIVYANMLPAYFFNKMGGVFKKLYDDIVEAQDKWYRKVENGKTFIMQLKRKYHYSKWEKRTLKLKTEKGDEIQLTVEQAMLLFATAKREYGNEFQKAEHLFRGGIVMPPPKREVKQFVSELKEALKDEKNGEKKSQTIIKSFTKEVDSRAHRITPEDILQIKNWLTDEQIAYVDDFVEYLSTDMAHLGNEISLQLYGIKKYNEDYYVPYVSAPDFLYSQPGVTNEARLKHQSFTKDTTHGANTPLILSDFSTVCADHINRMCMYNAFTIPLENLNKIFNYKIVPGAYSDENQKSVSSEIKRVFGEHAAKFIERFIKDMNGNVRTDNDLNWVMRWVSKFKKGAVLGSLSVMIQQPSAIMRVMAYINPKYFVKTTFKLSERDYQQCIRYSGIAGIKEMGRFDTGTGAGTVDWMLQDTPEGFKEKVKAFFGKDSTYRDDKLAFLPAKMDEITWGHIWAAVKAEIADTTDLKVGSEEYFKACGKRFNEVINLTQVYDSTLSRSQLMRSKNELVVMATAFMAEPTVSLNMLMDAADKFNKGGAKEKAFAVRAVAAFVSSVALNSLLKSLVTAARDDDEDKSYLEKYASEVMQNLSEGINPVNMIPFAKDIWSIFKGYTVERADMSLFSDLAQSLKYLQSDKKSGWEKFESVLGSVAAMFGIPAKNLIRDGKAVYNLYEDIFVNENETTWQGIKFSISESSLSDKYEALLDAAEEDDEETYQAIYKELIDSGKDDSDIKKGIKTAYGKSEEVQEQTEEYLNKLEKNKTYKSLDNEDKKELESNIKSELASEKTVNTLAKKPDRFDDLYEAYRTNKSKYKKMKQEMLDEGMSESLINDGFEMARIGYMKSKGIDIGEYLLYKIATSKKYADKDNSGGVSKAEKNQAIREMDIDEKIKNYFLYQHQ